MTNDVVSYEFKLFHAIRSVAYSHTVLDYLIYVFNILTGLNQSIVAHIYAQPNWLSRKNHRSFPFII